MRRFAQVVQRSCRFAAVAGRTVNRISRRIPVAALYKVTPRKIAVFVFAAAVPITAAAAPTNSKYHTTAVNFIENEPWDLYLTNPEKDLKLFTKTLEYARYCNDNVPKLKEMFTTINFKSIIYKLIYLDNKEQEAKENYPKNYLKIFHDNFGFDNVPNITNICTEVINSVGGWQYQGQIQYSIQWQFLQNNLFPYIHDEASRKSIIAKLVSITPTDRLFELIKTVISGSKTQIIVDGYVNFSNTYENFQFFASRDLIDASKTVEYLDKVVSNIPSRLQVYKILDYLITLNPDESAKKAMTLLIIQKMEGDTTEDWKTFLSCLIDKIDYTFTEDDTEKLTKALNDSYEKLRNKETKTRAMNLIRYISVKHPKLGVIPN
ncbi:MAG: hypothetical protein Hyperionvirus2_100 [Hyperionvirus sp.]|uniref:Uncharacterized protein n=1 Tax=Hyperionvirus sp. TaxID=2487770 RepID=A0A3G5A6S1_9VIRU|nr:MAG: hypothetical protein Hyperionvirus2_100 [Hyperionvirus sp.]